jgi:hypothetical protein
MVSSTGLFRMTLGVVALSGVVAFAGAAAADEPPSTHAPSRTFQDTVTESAPDPRWLSVGGLVFGSTYLTSVVVAGTSSYRADQRLYVPLAGPWLDLAARGKCGSDPNYPACGHETRNDALLVGDGIGQALGVLHIVGGFLFPTTRTVIQTRPEVVFAPTITPSEFAMTARGRF